MRRPRSSRPRYLAERLEQRTLLTTLIALAGDQLLTIDTDHAATPKATVNIQPAGLDIDNIAINPSNGRLYGVSADHLYTLDPASGTATQVDQPGAFQKVPGRVSCSFEPRNGDLLLLYRDESTTDPATFTREIDPQTGHVDLSESDVVTWASGSALEASPVSFRNIAFTSGYPSAPALTLFGNDRNEGVIAEVTLVLNPLAIRNPDPAYPISAPVKLGTASGHQQGWSSFTIGGLENTAFATAQTDTGSLTFDTLYQLDLTTGQPVRVVGSYPNLASEISSLAVVPSSLPTLSIQDATVAEPASSTADAVFRVTLSEPSASPVTVSYGLTDGTAVLNRDYQGPKTGSLTFNPGERAHTIHVPILPDAPNPSVHGPEYFSVSLLNPSGATLTRGTAQGCIHADGVNVLGRTYIETFQDFVSDEPQFDTSGVFHHEIDGTFRQEPSPTDVNGDGYSVGVDPTTGSDPALFLTRAIDRITFPNLDPGVHVALAKVDVKVISGFARVTVVGLNGIYRALITDGSQTVSVGEQHVLAGSAFAPILELGPIREIDLFGDGVAGFDNVGVFIGSNQAPVAEDFSVTTPPGIPVSIDVSPHASEAGGVLVYLDRFGTPGVPGSRTSHDPLFPDEVVYTPAPGRYTDSFTYTVVDASGQSATGTITLTINTPPSAGGKTFTLTSDLVPGGTARPGDELHGRVEGSDDDHDPLTFSLVGAPEHNNDAFGRFVFNSDGTFVYYLGALTDTFTFRASDGTDLSDVATVRIEVEDPKLTVFTAFQPSYVPAFGLDSLSADYPFSFTFGGTADSGGALFGPGPGNPGVNGDPGNSLTAILAIGTPLQPDMEHHFSVNTHLVLVSPPTRGDFFLYDDGRFRYQPLSGGFTGTDSFTVEATDGFQNSNPYTVYIACYRADCVATYGLNARQRPDCIPPSDSVFNLAETQDSAGRPFHLDASGAQNISNVQIVQNPSSAADYPAGTTGSDFPFGFIGFKIDDLARPPSPPTDPPIIEGDVGGQLTSGTYYVRVTYVNDAGGESYGGPISQLFLSAGQKLLVGRPGPGAGATGYRVYVATDPLGPYVLQGGTNPLEFGVTIDALAHSGPTPLVPPPDGPTDIPSAIAADNTSTVPSLIPLGMYEVKVTYTNAGGESLPSPSTSFVTVAAGQKLIIHSPPALTAPGWKAYVAEVKEFNLQTIVGPYILQGGINPIGTDLTLGAVLGYGPTPPTTTELSGTSVVKIRLPGSETGNPVADPRGYFKFGPTPNQPYDHWYSFLFDGHTGAKTHLTDPSVPSGEIDLYFIDGQRGDDDLTVNNSITDAGGPAFFASRRPGDANGDGNVDFADLLALAQNYGKTGATLAQGDFTGDGVVGFADLLILAQNYGSTSLTTGGTGASNVRRKRLTPRLRL